MLGISRLYQRGDTIIEVMIALAILGSALSLGMATSSQALTKARISQEHSQAQEYLGSQVELLRRASPSYATPASNIYVPNTFCLVNNGTDTPVRADFAAGNTATLTSPTPYPDVCVLDGRYYVSIVYTANTPNDDGTTDATQDDLFTIYIRWEGLGTLGRQQATMTYKIHQPTAGGGSIGGNGTPVPPPPPPPAASCPAAVPMNQFQACYYSDMTQTNFAFAQKENLQFDHDWGNGPPAPGMPSDKFSARWTGDFNVPAGTYTNTVTADDGIRVKVDGNIIIDKYFDQSPTTYSADVTLTAGVHRVVVEYYENGGGAVAKFSAAPTPPPPKAKNVIKPTTPITFYSSNGCTTQVDGQPISSGLSKVKDNDDNTGIITNCGSTNNYRFDLGASYSISQINVNWGPLASNIQKWGVATTDASGNAWCEFVGDGVGWRYNPPATATSDTAANASCHSGGSMANVRYVFVDEGNNNISLNEVRVIGTPN